MIKDRYCQVDQSSYVRSTRVLQRLSTVTLATVTICKSSLFCRDIYLAQGKVKYVLLCARTNVNESLKHASHT